MKNLKILLVLSVIALFPKPALALKVQAPLTIDNGTITCSSGNCTTASGTLTSNGVLIGGGSKAISTASLNATGTKMYLSQTSSGTPTFAQIAIGDLASFDSAALYTAMTGETGSGSGTPLAVFNQNPTIVGVTGTGTWGLTGATVNLPSGAVDAIGEIASSIIASTANGAKLATIGATALISGRCVSIDSDLNLVPHSGACGGTALNPRVIVHSQTPVTVTSGTPVFMSLGGAVSTTEAEVRTPFPAATVFGAMSCIVNAGTTATIAVTLGENACTTTADVTSKLTQTMSATANTVTTDSGSTTIAQDECGVIKLTTAGSPTQADVICTLEITG